MDLGLHVRDEIEYISCCVYICFGYVDSVDTHKLKAAYDDSAEGCLTFPDGDGACSLHLHDVGTGATND
jgi:hypothetical protein